MRLSSGRVGHGPDSVRYLGFAHGVPRWCPARGGSGRPSTSLLREVDNDVRKKEGSSVEVKIGVTDSPRELTFNSAQTPTEVEQQVTDALAKDSGVLALTDEKGRRFLVQNSRIAYVEIGAADVRRVGFGVGAESA
jgi:Protein of unknown function (DUF3107)